MTKGRSGRTGGQRWGWAGRAFVLLIAALVLHGCGSDDGGGAAPALELGALITMTADGDPDTQAAIALAIDDVNSYFAELESVPGGARQPRVRIEIEGTGLDASVAAEKIERLAGRGLKVVIGPESSAEVEAIKPFTDANGMVIVSHCSTAPALAIAGDSVYRMVPSDLRQAEAIAARLAADGLEAIVPMWREGIWGDGIASAVAQQFASRGGTVYGGVRFDPEAASHAADLEDLLAQVEDARDRFGERVAVAFFSFGTEGAVVLAQAAALPGLDGVPWHGSDGTALSREILGEARAAAFAARVGFTSTLFAEARTEFADAIRERIRAAMGGGDVHFCATAAYDAVWLAALAAAEAGTADIAEFERALVALAGAYQGATGSTVLDAAGDRAEAAYDVWAIREEEGGYAWRPVVP